MADIEGYRESIPCRDAAGRPRVLVIATTRLDEIAIITPPGDSATVAADQVEAVRDAFAKARMQVIRGGLT